jgi:uncharacterized membrane protein YjjB (DUF3815 family)
MHLIGDWRRSWQLRSVQVAGIGTLGALLGAIFSVTACSGVFLPMWAVWLGAFVIGVATIWARLVKQRSPTPHWNKRGERCKWR